MEDSLKLSEGMGEVPQDIVPADKEDSTDYSADFQPAAPSPPPEQLSPLVPELAFQDPVVSLLLADTAPAAPANIFVAPAPTTAPTDIATATATMEPEPNRAVPYSSG